MTSLAQWIKDARGKTQLPPALPALMTTQEVAELLRLDPATVRRWASDGRLKAVDMPGRAHRFRREDIEALIARRTGTVA